MQQAGTAGSLDTMEFGRRMAVERDIEKAQEEPYPVIANAIFDETGNFCIYSTMLGIKIINIVTNKVVRVIGGCETMRFMHIALYQGFTVTKSRGPQKEGISNSCNGCFR